MTLVNLGIGLATGRRSFKKVLAAYINTWQLTKRDMPKDIEVRMTLFVSYDLEYQSTQSTDFTNLSQEIVDAFENIIFIGVKNASRNIENLKSKEAFTQAELKSVFGPGYAGKRNAVLFSAIDYKMDYLLFLDDDEYPVAVTNNKNVCLWSGQQVFLTHLKEIEGVDYTNGYHCGYISPIPHVTFDDALCEKDFRTFIEAISNDIINWESIKGLMEAGGVTYASTEVLTRLTPRDVEWENGCRFISGANLCINLKKPERSLPFFNPPGARGEDTFLSTMLKERTVRKVPCYAFHDGFSFYQHLLDGVLPIHLAPITSDSAFVATRFLNACVGWVRYKPLLLYITRPDEFEQRARAIREALVRTLPLLRGHFHEERFLSVLKSLKNTAATSKNITHNILRRKKHGRK